VELLDFLVVKKEVGEAVDSNFPVVALESTIISHGMPYPQNVEVAKRLEMSVRKNGAIPATIALLDGKIHVGLDDNQIEYLGTSNKIKKASRRDLPAIIFNKECAATTVSATMICANLAGIKFFATGGIGGVHRNAASSFDVSADLQELGKTPVLVVCAGAKAILDIPATLEYLETHGIPVLGYKTKKMPAFYYPDSGYRVQLAVDTPEQAAGIFATSLNLGFNSGVVVGNPVALEKSMDKKEIESSISRALKEVEEQNIKGQKITPFLLSRLYEITAGKSLETNIALVESNVELCAQIAMKYCDMSKK
jgi:pseudouridine-5'-phosphate glycosidase